MTKKKKQKNPKWAEDMRNAFNKNLPKNGKDPLKDKKPDGTLKNDYSGY